MSSAVVSTSAASGRPFLFDDIPNAHVGATALSSPVEQSSTAMHAAPSLPGVARHDSRGRLSPREHLIQSTHNLGFPSASVTWASQLAIRPTAEMAPSGIAALDALTGGLPRGCLTELCGPASSGRTTVLLAALAAATRRGEFSALIDASDSLDPYSAAAAGIDLDHMLWVRCNESSLQKKNSPQRHRGTEKNEKENENKKSGCPTLVSSFLRDRVGISPTTSQSSVQHRTVEKHRPEHRLEQLLRATDLLLESGGFGLIVLDLADLPPHAARRIPLTTWFRFRRGVEHKPTILLAIEQHPIAGSCSSLLLQLGVPSCQYPVPSSNPSHMHLLTELQVRIEFIGSRLRHKPVNSATFVTRTAWAG